MDKILGALGVLPKKNEQISDTQGISSTVVFAVLILLALVAVTVIISKK